ncbi:DUF3231 family protein [Bacillus marasmi]|uniref:DUF3231 family protein n=1 Tax=Bacillus marasmi TaxID=1926279 RepID=UPI0011CC1F02|nr:DUF3231 family protein [Bacillus marasmi]
MDKNNIQLTSTEIGSLWGQFINGTMTYMVNKYMVTIIEDRRTKAIFEDAIQIFEKQKPQIEGLLERDGFPIPVGFNDADLNNNTTRLFTDVFCLNYLYVMTLHGLMGHSKSIAVSIRKDLRDFYTACNHDVLRMYNQVIELLLTLGEFQRDPLFYPAKNPEFITSKDFTDGFFGKGRCLAATEVISMSLNLKKSILAKALSIGFAQVSQSTEVRKFLEYSQSVADSNIQAFSKIMFKDNLPVPKSWETEITISTESPFSEKLMMYHMGFLSQVAQAYFGEGLASSMRADLIAVYESTIIKNLSVTKKWFNIMVKNKWLEQPPLAPNRKEIANEK